MVNPFDLRTILLAKHAQHVVLILDLLSRGGRNSQLASTAYLNLSIAAATVIPAVLTGLLAWQCALEGKRLKGLLLLHVIAASIAAVLVIKSWWIHSRTRKAEPVVLPRYRIPVELLAVAVIALSPSRGILKWSQSMKHRRSPERNYGGFR